MILEHLDTSKIQTTEWFMIELRSERTSEETIRRIGKELLRVFPHEPAEVFIPIKERDLTTFSLMTECYLFVRADDPAKVGKLRKVTGVLGILAADESTRASKFLRVPDDYVQGLIRTCWERHHQRALGITKGSWVRLIDGQMRDFCGYVVGVDGSRATVRVAARTKLIVVETSLHNLIDLSEVPPGARVFYYSEPVTRYLEECGTAAAEALAPDRAYDAQEMAEFLRQHEVEVTAAPGSKALAQVPMSREQTATRFVESLLEGGERDVTVLLAKTVAAIRSRHLRTPSTATVLWHVIRETIRRTAFGNDPTIKTYTDIMRKHGEAWALTPKQVRDAIPELPLRVLHETETRVTPVQDPLKAVRRPQTTVTTLVRKELEARRWDMWIVVAGVEQALQDGTLRAPKHVDSTVQAIRTQVLRHFRVHHPMDGIRALAFAYGPRIHVTTQEVLERYPQLQGLLDRSRREQALPVRVQAVTTLVPTPSTPSRRPMGVTPDRVTTADVAGIIPRKPSRALVIPTTATLVAP